MKGAYKTIAVNLKPTPCVLWCISVDITLTHHKTQRGGHGSNSNGVVLNLVITLNPNPPTFKKKEPCHVADHM